MLRGAPSYRVRRCLGPTIWTVPRGPGFTFPSGYFVSALRQMIDPELPAGSESPPFHPLGSTWLLAGIVSALRVMIDQELPGLYTWFEDNSLHVTIRGMI